jgi:hypothetical protein
LCFEPIGGIIERIATWVDVSASWRTNSNLLGISERWLVGKEQVQVGIRGDFSFVSFLCVGDKEKKIELLDIDMICRLHFCNN